MAKRCKGYHHLQSQELQQQSIMAVKSEIRCWVIKRLREQKKKKNNSKFPEPAVICNVRSVAWLRALHEHDLRFEMRP